MTTNDLASLTQTGYYPRKKRRRRTAMIITLDSDLEAALKELSCREGIPPEVLARNALRERFLADVATLKPRDDWELGLLAAARNCGVSLPDSALSSEGLYD
jgi:hypothetical protein